MTIKEFNEKRRLLRTDMTDLLNEAHNALMQNESLRWKLDRQPRTPCELCAYNPPTAMDGRPCAMCPAIPAERKEE